MHFGKVMGAMVAVAAGLMLTVGGWAHDEKGEHGHPPGTPSHTHGQEPVRISADELHQHGGVPPGWRFTLPHGDSENGKAVFAKMECFQCHAIQGEQFPEVSTSQGVAVGPNLTGVGSHHPPDYFAESILNPNAIIVIGPGYTGADGLSIMPDFREVLTLADLIDLVAYLESLQGAHDHGGSGKQPGEHSHPTQQESAGHQHHKH